MNFTKKILFVFIFLSFFNYSSARESIKSFDVEVRVNKDSSINVIEKINYDFDNLSNGRELHGLYRDIPRKYKADYGNFNFYFSDVSVNTDNYEFYKYGKYLRIDTNPDPDTHVNGVVPYIFKYKVNGTIGYFEDFDEIYWNATGDEWNVPINYASAKVVLPKPLPESQLKISCYQGVRGSKESCPHRLFKNNNLVESVVFFSSRNYVPQEGLTVAVGFPKGIVYEPTMWENILGAIWDNKIFMLPVLVFFLMFYLWYTKGRDPKGTGVIIPQYDVPDGLTPMEVGMIINEISHNNDISAEIIQLAIRGYLKIRKIGNSVLGGLPEDYSLEKTKDDMSFLPPHQKKLMESLFGDEEIFAETRKLENAEKEIRNVGGENISESKLKINKTWKIIIYVYTSIVALTAVITIVGGSYLPDSYKFIPAMGALLLFGMIYMIPILFVLFLGFSIAKAILTGKAKIISRDLVGEDTGNEISVGSLKREIRLSLLNEKFYKEASLIENMVSDVVVSKGYYEGKPGRFRSEFTIVSFLMVVACFLGGEYLYNYYGVSTIISLILSAIVIGVTGYYMPRKTEKGMVTYEYLLGLLDYLRIAEKDRLEFYNAPEKSPELFEKLLPYAMTLGVSKIWAKEFEGIYTTPPSWYSDVQGGTFNAGVFASSIDSFGSFAGDSLTSSPGSSSGSGGGGSSGGGGGGGGGGSH